MSLVCVEINSITFKRYYCLYHAKRILFNSIIPIQQRIVGGRRVILECVGLVRERALLRVLVVGER